MEQFREMMDKATRHFGGIAFHGRGTKCGGCGAFVEIGEEHPWSVPEKQEAVWWEEHPDAPHKEKAFWLA